MRPRWNYIAGALLLIVSLVLFTVSIEQEKRARTWYSVAGGACLVVGVVVMGLGLKMGSPTSPTTHVPQMQTEQQPVITYTLAPPVI